MPPKRIASAFADDDDWRDPLWRRRAHEDAVLRRIEAELLHLQMRRNSDALRHQMEQVTIKLDQMTATMREQLRRLERRRVTKTLFPHAVITGEMLPHLRLPEIDDRYELVEGHIVPVAPSNLEHAETLTRITVLLIKRMPGWIILAGDPGLYVRRRPDTVRGPDLIAISAERYATRDVAHAFLAIAPELVIEIVSPSDAEEDIGRKVAEYMAIGSTVWVVDLDAEIVAVNGVIAQTLTLPNGVTVDIAELMNPR